MSIPVYTLLDGHTIPRLGFGSGTAHLRQDAVKPVLMALHANYMHIDTAQMYGNEDTVGDAIAQSGVPREKVFLTTKFFELTEGQTVEQSLKSSLEKLKPGQLEDVWRQMEGVKEAGLARSIGISNFRLDELERVLRVAKHKPVVNQLEFHPYNYEQLLPVLKLQAAHGILTESWGGLTPLTRKTDGPVNAVLQELGKKIRASQGQILMKWLEQKRVIVVTTTSKEARLKEYVDVYALPELSDEDMKAIDEAGRQLHYSASELCAQHYFAQKVQKAQ
ncbi:Aldo/keto reductase [Dacryopinax primogenitus]|uniref:Aldo/keto reductase n=1 Tax=Dacryopinax primogenitus (strain DJM 731) TaxID=1858805 RepID=M5FN44_DACPD|nr:Aldo/keto reductase [Dacryopinax primogenitus]EJT96800.1 Aldo/keto reductase [Dacryopinax primogenitus]